MLGVVRGLEVISLPQIYHHLYRPTLVEEILKGDPERKYKDGAFNLNLEKIMDSGPAPQLLRLERRTERIGDHIKLAVRIADTGGGIGPKVVWRIDGRTKGEITAQGLAGPPSPGRYFVMEQMLPIDPGSKNEIEVIAYNWANGKSLLASLPLQFTVDSFGVTDQERPRLYVLATGINDYVKKDWQLRYAVKDARDFAQAMVAVGHSLFGQVQVTRLLDDQATKRDIGEAFEHLSKIVKRRDVFVLFVSGHGRSIAGRFYYLPQEILPGANFEIGAIDHDTLQKWLAKIDAAKMLLILDTCEAGASEFFRGSDRQNEEMMGQLEAATGLNIIGAAPQGKIAFEGYKGHGVLTYALLEAMNKSAAASEEPVDVYALAAHVARRVPVISQMEFSIPQKPETKLRDNFPLGVRAVVLKEVGPDSKPALITRDTIARQAAAVDAPAVMTLKRGERVNIKDDKDGWSLIERNGRDIGFTPSDDVIPIPPN
jgi:hypothetical protein